MSCYEAQRLTSNPSRMSEKKEEFVYEGWLSHLYSCSNVMAKRLSLGF